MRSVDDVDEALRDAMRKNSDRKRALEDVFQKFENAGVISKVIVGRYICAPRGCRLATVLRVGSKTILSTRDYKLSPGKNEADSVASARSKRTLDGQRHWPSQVFDLDDMGASPGLGIKVTCRHVERVLDPREVLALTSARYPGRPGPPVRLG